MTAYDFFADHVRSALILNESFRFGDPQLFLAEAWMGVGALVGSALSAIGMLTAANRVQLSPRFAGRFRAPIKGFGTLPGRVRATAEASLTHLSSDESESVPAA